MKISTNNLVPISDANQNFSQVAKRVDKDGSAIIMKNNKPRYLLVPFQQAEREQNEEDDVFEITQLSFFKLFITNWKRRTAEFLKFSCPSLSL